MTTTLRVSACLLVAVSLAACNQSDAPTPAASPADETAAPATADAPQPEEQATPYATEDAADLLTMDNARAYVQALENLDAIGVDSVSMEGGESLEQYQARLESVPQVVAAIEEADMSVDDFARFGEVFIAGVVAQSMIEAGQMQAPPEGLEAAVEFAEQNKAEIHALFESLEEAGG